MGTQFFLIPKPKLSFLRLYNLFPFNGIQKKRTVSMWHLTFGHVRFEASSQSELDLDSAAPSSQPFAAITRIKPSSSFGWSAPSLLPGNTNRSFSSLRPWFQPGMFSLLSLHSKNATSYCFLQDFPSLLHIARKLNKERKLPSKVCMSNCPPRQYLFHFIF